MNAHITHKWQRCVITNNKHGCQPWGVLPRATADHGNQTSVAAIFGDGPPIKHEALRGINHIFFVCLDEWLLVIDDYHSPLTAEALGKWIAEIVTNDDSLWLTLVFRYIVNPYEPLLAGAFCVTEQASMDVWLLFAVISPQLLLSTIDCWPIGFVFQ